MFIVILLKLLINNNQHYQGSLRKNNLIHCLRKNCRCGPPNINKKKGGNSIKYIFITSTDASQAPAELPSPVAQTR
jgi:hypothetical protein